MISFLTSFWLNVRGFDSLLLAFEDSYVNGAVLRQRRSNKAARPMESELDASTILQLPTQNIFLFVFGFDVMQCNSFEKKIAVIAAMRCRKLCDRYCTRKDFCFERDH